MKIYSINFFGAIALTVFCLLTSINAQPSDSTSTPSASLQLTTTPSKLTIAAVRGDSPSRQFLFSANAAADFKIIAFDLTRGDDMVVIPASAIVATPNNGKIAANDSQKVVVTFNLAGAPGGEFNGELRVQHSGGQKLSIPLTVKIKHWFLWPLLTLILGVGLSMLLSWYRDQGKPRDEVQVRVAQLRGELRAEDDLAKLFAKPFLDRVNIALIDVDIALRAKKWEDARKQVEQAEELIAKWRKYRDDWRRQLDFGESLLKTIDEAKGKSLSSVENVYLRLLSRNLEDTKAQAPDAKSPAELRDKLDKINSDFAKYQSARLRLDALTKSLNDLDSDAQNEWRERLKKLGARLEAMPPESAESFNQLQADIDEAGVEMQNALPGAKTFSLSAKSANESFLVQLHLNAPDLLSRDLEADTQAARAGWNLRWSSRLLVIISLALLVGAGYAQLYESKPTFGANFWADYSGLFAWGFGVEASRAAVSDWLKGFNLSLWK